MEDLEAALRRALEELLGDEGLMDLFCAETSAQLDALGEAADAGDTEEVRRLAHTDNGAAAGIEQDPGAATGLLDDLQRAFELTQAELTR